MIYLEDDCLEIRFPELHRNAGVSINFQRTLRLPDDGETHHLPPGLGKFPLRHIEDFDLGNRNELKKRGGLIMPMFQADALWMYFDALRETGDEKYPIAIKIGTGKVCAVSGENWSSNLNRDPQDYVVVPEQPWIDGYNVSKGTVRQFVAAPLGQGYTAEEQLTGKASVGGIQIQAFPMKREHYDRINQKVEMSYYACAFDGGGSAYKPVGLAPGGAMRQEIFDDPHNLEVWDLRKSERCFVNIANADQWMGITGEEPPISPFTAHEYTKRGLPWYEYYSGDKVAIDGAKRLGKLKSVRHVKPNQGGNFWEDDLPVMNPKVTWTNKKNITSGDW